MTIIDQKELDRRMSQTIDPNSVPKHDGGDLGAMQGVIARGSEDISTERGAGKRGAAVYALNEVGPQMSGSATVISVNDAPPLPAKMDPAKPAPAPAPVAAPTRSPQEILLSQMFGPKK